MSEAGKETATPAPPPPQTGEAVGDRSAAPDDAPHASEPAVQAPADVAEPGAGPAASSDLALRTGEQARRAPSREQSDAVAAAAGQPEQTTEAAVDTPPVTEAERMATLPRPTEAPPPESAEPAAPEADKQLPAPPPQRRQQGKQEDSAPAEEDSSFDEEGKDAEPAQEGEGKPARGDHSAAPDVAPREGEPAPQALADVEQPGGGPTASPEQATEAADDTPLVTEAERAASLPRPTEAPPPESAPPEAERQLSAPPPQQQEEEEREGGAAEEDSSVHEKGKDAAPTPAPAPAQEGGEKPARGWWPRLRAVVRLAFHRPKRAAPPSGDKAKEAKPSSPGGKQPPSGAKEKKPAPVKKPSHPKDSAGGVPAKTATKGKDEGDVTKSLSRRDEAQASPGKPQQPERRKETQQAGTAAGETPEKLDVVHPSVKRFQKVGKLVQWVMSLYQRHRSSSSSGERAAADDGKGGEIDASGPPTTPDEKQPAATSDEKQPPVEEKPSAAAAAAEEEEKKKKKQKLQRKWAEEEKRLETILENAFTKLLVTEYNHLSCTKQKCLLTFSVFHLHAEVKKQAMLYWWVSEFNLPHGRSYYLPRSGKNSSPGSPAEPRKSRWRPKKRRRRATAPAEGSDSSAPQGKAANGGELPDTDAEGVFSELYRLGFLEAIEKNNCTGAIHGCRVNPLVHWMVKRQARDDRFADLDERGNPADSQPESAILCLTSGNRAHLLEVAMEDEPQAGSKQQQTATATGGTPEQGSTQDGEPAKAGSKQQTATATGGPPEHGSTKDGEPTKAGSKQQIATATEGTPEHGSTKDGEPTKAGSKQQIATATEGTPEHGSTKDGEPTKELQHTQTGQNDDAKENLALKKKQVKEKLALEKKKVILNVNAHVYRLSKSLFSQLRPDNLVMLQLGQWWSHEDNTYMEVEGLESLRAIGNLKNLRYLSLRGLSRLTELPDKIQWPKNLAILDMRGCQNLERVVSKAITPLKQLTHLDLTDCYMLEYIGKGVTSLSELQVFKGFVFGVGALGTNSCRLQDLRKLKKLQKLTISVTTDANVGKKEMAELKHLSGLRSLTVTWGELPSILTKDETPGTVKKRDELLNTWTCLELPPELLKLDVRCYPKPKLELKEHKKLEKLYIRGGDMKNLDVQGQSCIKILRLRYLIKFNMEWKDLLVALGDLEYVEIMVKDKKLMKLTRMHEDEKDEKSDEEKRKALEERQKAIEKAMEEERKLILNMVKKLKIPDSTLDDNGVWVRDKKEVENQTMKKVEDQGTIEKSKDVTNNKDLDNIRKNDEVGGAPSNAQPEGKEEDVHSSRDAETTEDREGFHGELNEAANDTDDAISNEPTWTVINHLLEEMKEMKIQSPPAVLPAVRPMANVVLPRRNLPNKETPSVDDIEEDVNPSAHS
ncbi:hypothetical protein ACP70R_027203 [Stipagrostis hirtigluma subsp. patula]